jgi:hypothetical protein
MRSATNPGGLGHSWVKRRFVDRETATAPFVPALLDDNPFIDQVGYRESLSRLDSLTRDQLERGIWRNDAAGLVYALNESRNVVQHTPMCNQYILGIDYGATRDACAFSVIGWRWNEPTVYVVKSYRKPKMIPSEAAEEALRLNETFKFQRVIGDANGLGAGYVGEARRRFKVPVEPADKNNKPGYIKLFNGDLERGLIKVVRSDCQNLLDEYFELPWADEGRSKEAEGFNNHCADATLYAWRSCQAYMAEMRASQPLAIRGPFAT